jgi:hypothetical protein
MRIFYFVFLLSYAGVLHATPTAKELATEAKQLERLATQETNPQQAKELKRSACGKWQEAYDVGKQAEGLLRIGLCRQELGELEAADTAFRLFLLQASAGDKNRPAAEQALERIAAERQAAQEKVNPPALTLAKPVPIEESPTQWKRRTLFVGGALTGLSLVGSAIAFGIIRSQDEFSQGTSIVKEIP